MNKNTKSKEESISCLPVAHYICKHILSCFLKTGGRLSGCILWWERGTPFLASSEALQPKERQPHKSTIYCKKRNKHVYQCTHNG